MRIKKCKRCGRGQLGARLHEMNRYQCKPNQMLPMLSISMRSHTTSRPSTLLSYMLQEPEVLVGTSRYLI